MDPAKRSGGIELIVASTRRPGPTVLDPRVKSLNYLNNILAKLEARRSGADEALLLNERGQALVDAVYRTLGATGTDSGFWS